MEELKRLKAPSFQLIQVLIDAPKLWEATETPS